MKNLIAGAGLTMALALAGCGDAEQPEDVTQIEVPSGDVYQSQLQTMDEGARNATFIRALRDAGRQCQHVESSSFVGEENGVPTWTATCDDGVQWTIMIGNDGVAQVLSPQGAAQANVSTGAPANSAAPAQ